MRSVPDAILLCGGAGLRLRSVIGNGPKGMARGRRPAISGTVAAADAAARFRSRHFSCRVPERRDSFPFWRAHVRFGPGILAESFPLGTGGALRNAADLVESDSVLIMNGDSYTDADLSKLVASHRQANADASVVVVPADGRGDCGSVLLDENGAIGQLSGETRAQSHAPYLNAGIYIVSRQLLYEYRPEFRSHWSGSFSRDG